MRLGKAAMEALRAEVTGLLVPGDELVVVGPVALLGTSWIAEEKYEELRNYFSQGFLVNTKNLYRDYNGTNGEAWKLAEGAGAHALYSLKEGGFLAGLWKLAEASQTGLEVDLRKVPIRQETIELCEIFDLNPYKLHSEGALLIGMQGGEAFVQECKRQGWMAAVIGQTNRGNDRLLYSGENARYLERPSKDEYLKIGEKRWQD